MSLLGTEPGTSCASTWHVCPLRSQRALLMRPKPFALRHGRTQLPYRGRRSLPALAFLPASGGHNRHGTDSIPIATGSGAA
jgi:hypothetical protein